MKKATIIPSVPAVRGPVRGASAGGFWRTLAVLAAAAALPLAGTGCISGFQTSTYETPAKPVAALQRTNFRVASVSTNNTEADKERLLKALQALESRQNGDLFPLPYHVSVTNSREDNTPPDVLKALAGLTLFVLPWWEGGCNTYGIQTEIAASRDTASATGKEKYVTIYSWLMLPTGVIQALMMSGWFDFRPGTLEERLAEAAFGTLTEERYRAGVEAMRADAVRRLEGGGRLSEADERLLREGPMPLRLLVARAKHPGDPAKSREALRGIDGTGELEDIALHAEIPEIRREAAAKIPGLSEERCAELAGRSDDASVAQVFLQRVSSPKPLYFLVENAGAQEAVREAALARIASERVLAHVAKSTNGPVSLRLSALERVKSGAALADVARHGGFSEVRLAAVVRVDDAGVLADAVASDPDAAVREAALRKIGDPAELGRIALGHWDADIRRAALERVADPEVVGAVAEKDPSPRLRIAAVEKLEDGTLLARVARTDAVPEVRRTAVGRLADPAILAEIAQNADDPSVRLEAVPKIRAQDVLSDLARHDRNEQVRCRAVVGIADQDELVGLYESERSPAVKNAIMPYLSAESKRRLAEAVRNGAPPDAISLAGFRLGMAESDARLLFDCLLPGVPADSCATFENGAAVRFRFSARELQQLLGASRALSVDMLPGLLEKAMHCRFRHDPETIEIRGMTVAEMEAYRFSSIDGETLAFYVSPWKIDQGARSLLIDQVLAESYPVAQLFGGGNNEWFDMGFALGVPHGVDEAIEKLKAQSGAEPGTLVWSR